MMWRVCMLMALVCLDIVAAFRPPSLGIAQSVFSPLGRLQMRRAAKKGTVKVCMRAGMDRRKALAVFSAWQVAEFTLAISPAAAGDDTAKLVERAVNKICTDDVYNPMRTSDLAIAIVDNGSPLVKAAAAGVKASGATPVPLKGDVKTVQATYKTYKAPDADGNPDEFGLSPSVAIVPDVKVLKEVMSGTGLECEKCGFGGGATGPKWIMVLDSQGKDDKTLAADGGISSLQCDETGKMCFQVGLAVPVYGLEAFVNTKKFNKDSGRFE